MNKKALWIFVVCALSILAAVGTHIYLTSHHYEVKYGVGADGGICDVNETVNCNVTTLSSYSEVFGIPVAILGALINLALFILLSIYYFGLANPSTRRSLAGSIRLISLGIFAASVVMAALSYGVLKTVCPGCTAAYVLSLITLVTAWMVTEKSPLFSKFDLKLYPVLAVSVLLISAIAHNSQINKYGGKERMKIIEAQLSDWHRTPEKPIEPHAPITMNSNPSAKMKIVEFADFLCGHCANAYPVLHSFVKSHPEVEFHFQAWPLDGECNSAINHAEGTRCMLARVSHCANEQGQAWATQEWIFQNQRYLMSKDMVQSQLQANAVTLGLDLDKLLSCVDSEEAREAIRSQSKVGTDLNINGTPSVFVNGKKLPAGFSRQLLQKIYQEIK